MQGKDQQLKHSFQTHPECVMYGKKKNALISCWYFQAIFHFSHIHGISICLRVLLFPLPFLLSVFYNNTFPVNNLADILGRYTTTTDQLNCSKYSAFACLRKVGELWEQIELLREHICHLWCWAQNLPDHMMALLLYASLRQTGLSITVVTVPPQPLLTAKRQTPQRRTYSSATV